MSDAPSYCSPVMPWGDKQITRFNFRVALFLRRGAEPWLADALADRLAERDHERDDRRMCIECQHMQRDGGCFAAKQGWMKAEGISESFKAMPEMLQRCSQFKFVTP